ncbi:cellulose biosynthesis protein BcsG [uncultured Photobacterium sp.]|uniref:cellulose biosynthesis protein BcsG n=1 Tax=uncultured Photobacterium sp. TaxID=173973 RepID=UPI0026280D4E|nr:cellulose biosynthesis protein BcsG [uncultured Photobacterium sp.]
MEPDKIKTLSFNIGIWNLYFITKLIMSIKGSIGFSPLYNFTLFVFFLIPTKKGMPEILKNFIGFCLAISCLYYDSFLPPLARFVEQFSQLQQFDSTYLIEILFRFIDQDTLVFFAFLSITYYLANKIFKVTSFVLIAMLYISFIQQSQPFFIQSEQAPRHTLQSTTNTLVKQKNESQSDLDLNQLKSDFFINEESKTSTLHSKLSLGSNFDILLLNICSIAWDDLDLTGQINHPLFDEFDIFFENFNSATSYSGPAIIRLLRASCGQQEHTDLFSPPNNKKCLLFQNLEKIGFKNELILNHDGNFGNFMTHISNNVGGIKSKVDLKSLQPYQKSFDGSSIYRDFTILTKWLTEYSSPQNAPTITLYNSISAHDGNRIIRNDTNGSLLSYKKQQKNILDDLYNFMDQLKKSQRNFVVVFVPEHGAALRGDKMQIQGMREIPTRIITHVPVGIKLLGSKLNLQGGSIKLNQPSSYLAISDLIGNIITHDIFSGKPFHLTELVNDLDHVEFLSQNQGTTMMNVQGSYYLTLDNKNWIQYSE